MFSYICAIEEGKAASKSLHQKFGYFLSTSQQAVSPISFQKQKEQGHKQLGYTDKMVTAEI